MPTTSKNRYNPSSEDSADLLPTYNPQAPTGRMRHAYTTEGHEEENYQDFERHTRNEQSYAELGEHLQWHGIELTPMLTATLDTAHGRFGIEHCKSRDALQETLAALRGPNFDHSTRQYLLPQDLLPHSLAQEIPHSLRHRLPGLRPPPAAQAHHPQAITPSPPPAGVTGGQGQGPVERWEQVPLSIQLMNEICDAMSIGSDFAFWTGLIIIVIVLVGLMIWYAG
ncbi:hypothetical protein EJ07DRAFT_179392 [Lizonia empirigonia]|nr:hypothetical protein EJ07DRAFT_179392 [Lizonia empirigonia]